MNIDMSNWVNWIPVYLLVGLIFLLVVRGYKHFPPPSRLVKVEGGRYKYKDYIPMPDWLWYIVLTVFWLPYLILLFFDIRKNISL